jgi:hypothetical protein
MRTEQQLHNHIAATNRCGQRFILTNKTYTTDLFNNEKEKKLAPLPLYCKSYFCKCCAKKKAAKYRARIKNNLKHKSWRFLTLTTINNTSNKIRQIKQINQDWNRLRTLLKKHFGNFSYVKVVEIGKGGMVHLHVLVDMYLPVLFIKRMWIKYCGAYRIWIDRVQSHEDCIKYVTKYMTKSASNHEFNTIMYKANSRRITFSRDIKLKPISDATYKLESDHIFRDKELINTLTQIFVDKNISYFDFDFSHLPPPLDEYFKHDFKFIYEALSNRFDVK